MINKGGLLIFLVMAGGVSTLLLLRRQPPVTTVTNRDTALVTAGRRLFFDTRISFNNTKSCGSCHDPKFAFTDSYRRSITANGENLLHNSPSLINAASFHYYDWANPAVQSLEKQQERPLFSTHPAEMDVSGHEAVIVKRLEADPQYRALFGAAFPEDSNPFDFKHIIKAISAFERSLVSYNAPYDRYLKGDTNALEPAARKGMELFFSARLHCGACHVPPLFTTAASSTQTDSIYFNTGLYNIGNQDRYPPDDKGLAAFSGRPEDDGKFKVPSLRNVALTAPYMHDGSVNTLAEVITLYEDGGRLISNGPAAGDGRKNSHKNPFISGFRLSEEERKNLLSFLFSLTDSSILSNARFQNPFNLADK
ncbi:MAG: di-heme enzyme [Ferruginibacter sp.]